MKDKERRAEQKMICTSESVIVATRGTAGPFSEWNNISLKSECLIRLKMTLVSSLVQT